MDGLLDLRKFKTNSKKSRREKFDEDESLVLNRRHRRSKAAIIKRKIRRTKKTNILENRNKQFARLSDPDPIVQKQLEDEFIPYAMRAHDFYSQIAAITAYLRAHLNDRTIIYSAAGMGTGIPANLKKPELPYREYYDKVKEMATNSGRYLKIKGNVVQLNIAPVSFTVACKLTAETIPIIEKKFGILFGGQFKVPQQFTRNEKHETIGVTEDYTTGLKPLRYYMRLNYTPDEAPGYYQPPKLASINSGQVVIDDVIDAKVLDATTVEVKLQSATIKDYSRNMIGETAGPISQNQLVEFNFRVMGVATLPLEYALWATHATDLTDFVPKLFREHFDNIGKTSIALGKTKMLKMLARTMHVGKVKELNTQRTKDYGIKVKPRVNADNFCILAEVLSTQARGGRVYYVPPVDQAVFYIQTLRANYDEQTGLVKSNSEIKELHNIPLLTDWINDGFAYTDSNGRVQAQRLIGAIPLDDVTIARDLGFELGSQSKDWLEAFGSRGDQVCREFGLYDTSPAAHHMGSNFFNLVKYITDHYGTYPYHQIVSDTAKTEEDIVRPQDKPLITEFIRLCASIAKNLMQTKEFAISTRCDVLYHYHLFGIYVTQYSKHYYTKLQASREENALVSSDKLPTSFAIPNLPGIKTALPHQVPMLAQSIVKAPHFVVMDISAGGGKCIDAATIPTSKGLFSIKELRQISEPISKRGFRKLNNIEVMTSEGMLPATATYSRKGRITIITMSDGTRVGGLPVHRIHDGNNFVRLENMRIGDSFAKHIGLNIYGKELTLPVKSNIYPVELIPELAELLGYIAAEGHNSEKYAKILTITMFDQEIQQHIIKLMNKVFGETKREFVDNIIKLDPEEAVYLKQLINPATSARVTVPLCVRQAPKELQQIFLRALFEGDGWCYFEQKPNATTGRWHLGYGSISQPLVRQVKTMLENMGFVVQLYRKSGYWSANGNAAQNHVVTKRYPYELQLNTNDFSQFGEDIGFNSSRKQTALTDAINYVHEPKQQQTNEQVFGIANALPQHSVYYKLIARINKLISRLTYSVAFGNQQRQVTLTLATAVRLLEFSSNEYTSMLDKLSDQHDRKITKFNAHNLLKLIEQLPRLATVRDIAADQLEQILVDEKLCQLKTQLQVEINTVWVTVKSISRGRRKRVYDLRVPGPSDYIADSMLNHNTFQMLVHAIELKRQGKIKVAIVVCPGRLIHEWTSQVNEASKGAINIVPISSVIIQKIVKDLGWDRAKYMNYLRNAPINTIFVVSLNFLSLTTDHFTGENLGGFMQFGEQYIRFFPNVQMLRQLEPDLIMLDESHYAKNAKSKRTAAMYSFSPISDYRVVASGTIMQNDPGDMPAQYGLLNPTILGTKEQFQERYGITQNGKFLKIKSGMEGEISRRRAPYAFAINKSRRDWSQLLPLINISFVPVELTEAQQAYYDDILNEQISELLSDPGVIELMKKSDPASQAKLEASVEAKLHIVESFVNAPDTHNAFVRNTKLNIKNKDLRSPKSAVTDELIRQHIENRRDPNKIIVFCYNKDVSKHFWRWTKYQDQAVHYAVAGSEPRAGEDTKMSSSEALLRFRQDDKIKIIFADETSLREGLNLQMASEIIRVQTLYAPGAQEQAMSRALRPDVSNKYKREEINIEWLVTNHSHEVGKAARMIAKMITIHKKKEEDNPKWLNFIKGTAIPDLELMSLNLHHLNDPKYNTIGVDTQGRINTSEELKEYFDSYHILNDWEIAEFNLNKQELLASTAKRLGKPVSQINIRTDSQIPLVSKTMLPGSKSMWVPLANGTTVVDSRELNLKPLAILVKEKEDDDDEDDEDDDDRPRNKKRSSREDNDDEPKGTLVDAVTYGRDTLVYTEYGWGRIGSSTEHSGVRTKVVLVKIPGFQNGEPIAIDKQVAFTPTPPVDNVKSPEYLAWKKRVRQLEKELVAAGTKGITFMQGIKLPPVSDAPTPKPRQLAEEDKPPTSKPKMIVKRDANEDDENDEPVIKRKAERNIPQHAPVDKKSKPSGKGASTGKRIFIDAMVINGIPALMAYTDEDGFSTLETYCSWYRVPKFLNAQIRTYPGALNLIKYIETNFPDTKNADAPVRKQLDQILLLAKRMRGQTTNALQVRRATIPYSAITPFVKTGHTVTKSPAYIKVFPVVWNHELFVSIPIGVQPAQAQKMRSAIIKGVEKFTRMDEMAVHFGTSVKRIRAKLDEIAQGERLLNYNNTVSVMSNPNFAGLISA